MWRPSEAMRYPSMRRGPHTPAAERLPFRADEWRGCDGGGPAAQVGLADHAQTIMLRCFGQQFGLVCEGADHHEVGVQLRGGEIDPAFLRRVGHLDQLLGEGEIGTDADVHVAVLVGDLLHGGRQYKPSAPRQVRPCQAQDWLAECVR